MFLEVIDEMTPILEPKPNVRLHRNTPEMLLDKVTDMISSSQGAPFLLNFDERSMAGMLLEAEKANISHLIHKDNVHDYAPVGCLENTMVGNDRSGTVDNNLNLLKAVELALNNGRDLRAFTDPLTGKTEKIKQDGPATGDATRFKTFDDFWQAYAKQTEYIIKKCVDTHELSEATRAKFTPTPYLSCLVKGCADQGRDVTQGGAEISFTTLEAVTYAQYQFAVLNKLFKLITQMAFELGSHEHTGPMIIGPAKSSAKNEDMVVCQSDPAGICFSSDQFIDVDAMRFSACQFE